MTPIVLISSSAGSPTTSHLGALVLPKHVQLLPPTEFCSSYLNTIGLRIDSQTLRKDSVQVFCGDGVWEMITKIPGAQQGRKKIGRGNIIMFPLRATKV